MPDLDFFLLWLALMEFKGKNNYLLIAFAPLVDTRTNIRNENILSLLSSQWQRGLLWQRISCKLSQYFIALSYILLYCLLQIHVRLNYTFVCMSGLVFCSFPTVGKSVCENINFHVDLCAQRPDLHGFNTAM